MKDLLLRAAVLAVAAAGVVTVVVVARLVFSPVPPPPEREAGVLEFDEARALERLVGGLAATPASLQSDLEEAFPRVHGTLQLEALEDGLLLYYTWEGAEPEMAPILLASHGGLVPEGAGRSSAQEAAASSRRTAASAQQLSATAQGLLPPARGPVAADGETRRPGVGGVPLVMLAILEAVEGLLAQGMEPRRTVLLAFSADGDDVGSQAGSTVAADAGTVVRVLAERGIRPAWVLVGGAGSDTGLTTGLVPGLVDPVALVGVAERGFLEIELTLASEAGAQQAGDAPGVDAAGDAGPTRRYGRVEVGPMGRRADAGGGSAWQGPPAALLAQAVARLEEPFDARIEGPGRELLETTAPHMDPGTRMLIRNLWLFRGPMERALARETGSMELVRTTATPTFIRAGVDDGAHVSGGRPVEDARESGATRQSVEGRSEPRGRYDTPGATELTPDGAALARVRLQLAPWDSVEDVLETIRDRLRGLGVEVSIRADAGFPVEPDPARSADSYRGEGFQEVRAAVHHAFPDVIAVAPGVALTPTQGRRYHDVAGAVYRFSPFRLRVGGDHAVPDPVITERHYLAMVRFYAELLRQAAPDV